VYSCINNTFDHPQRLVPNHVPSAAISPSIIRTVRQPGVVQWCTRICTVFIARAPSPRRKLNSGTASVPRLLQHGAAGNYSPHGAGRLHSAELGLWRRAEDGDLVLYHAATGEKLPTESEVAYRRGSAALLAWVELAKLSPHGQPALVAQGPS
jgi:hypothetical protein